MRITVAKSDLEGALRVAEIGTGSGADISSHFVFRIKDGTAEILSWNQRVCVKVPVANCTVEGDEGKAFTAEASRIGRWLGGVGDEPVEISDVGDGDVRLVAPNTSIEIPSLDPSKYAYWDAVYAAAKQTASVKGSRLAAALAYVRTFIHDSNDTTRPEIAQTEVVDGVLWATDKKAMTLVTLDVLSGSNLRIFGKDIGLVTKFLTLKGDEEVAVLEHDRQLFLRRPDGAVLGVVRPISQFPKFSVDQKEVPTIFWEVRTEDLLKGVKCLSAAAESMDNPRIRFAFDNGKVVLAVKGISGKQNLYLIAPIEHEGTDGLPADGFSIDQSYIDKVVKQFNPVTLKFGIHKRDGGGFIRFRYTPADNTDEYLTVVVWRN